MNLVDGSSPEAAIWQLVESCGYTADLPVWSGLLGEAATVLDLGCGIGRVSRHLASEDLQVVGVDNDRELVGELNRLSGDAPISAITGDVTRLDDLELPVGHFEAVIAPQQLIHILGGQEARFGLFSGVRQRLEPGGIAAFAISEWVPDQSRPVDVLPDMREIGDWVFASRPIAVEQDEHSLTVIRLRQKVGPDGSLSESEDRITLDRIDRRELAGELRSAGLAAVESIEVPETDRHIATVIVVAGHAASEG